MRAIDSASSEGLERPLVEVALDVGYADQAHFTRAYRSSAAPASDLPAKSSMGPGPVPLARGPMDVDTAGRIGDALTRRARIQEPPRGH